MLASTGNNSILKWYVTDEEKANSNLQDVTVANKQ